ncbi:MAG: AraC family transcriptional regulator [Ktedonobacterales bacterium]
MNVANNCMILQRFKMRAREIREEVPMDVMTHSQAERVERDEQRVQANRAELAELVERIARAVREDGTVQLLQGLHLSRSSVSLEPLHSVLEPALCVIAQGSKEVLLGESRYWYDPSRYLLATRAGPDGNHLYEKRCEIR